MYHYHNTNSLSGPALDQYEELSYSQEQVILRFMKKHPGIYYRPDEIKIWVFGSTDVPITSIRRALSNLTRDGQIVKSEIKDKGPYGRPVNQWVLPGKIRQLQIW